MSSQPPDEARNYDITFVTSQRGMKLPVIDGYVFVCKDKARKRFTCRTRSCRTTLTLKQDENGVYTDETIVHTHPPHETIIASLKHKNEMREAAKNHRTSLATTRSIATRVREENLAVRRLSTDLRFIRRFRQGNACPKTASEIILNEETTPFVLYHSQANEVVIFGDGEMVHAAASVSFICVDGTFSRCPQTTTNLSRATPFVGVGFHSRSCSRSFLTKNRLRIQRSSRRSIQLHVKNSMSTSFLERV